ncbi:MAG: DUF58 domain-containing protein [Gammaproteobacteria bacterium]|nr:DUF58 domain-containing protein [Gammaproteobacteria bacterium]
MEPEQENGDDVVRVRLSSLIGLNRDARSIPLISNSIKAHKAGSYLSAFRGRGMEFHESRLYQPGDDIRTIDWRVTARSGKTHTKVYREERERPVLLWVDLQQPMFFGTRNCYKSVLAAKLAALMAWSSVQHGDRLGGLIFSEQEHIEARPKRGKAAALHFIRQLVAHSAWSDDRRAQAVAGNTGAQALNRLRQVARPGSLIVLISDFRFLDETCRMHLAQLARHNDVVLLFTHDPLEQNLPPSGHYRLTDGVSELAIDSTNRASRGQYQQRFDHHHQAIERLCNQLQLFLIDISTANDVLDSLQAGLGLQRLKKGS